MLFSNGLSRQSLSLDLETHKVVPFEKAIVWFLGVLILFSVLALGVVEAWSELIVFTLSGAVLLLFLFGALKREDLKLRLSLTYIPFFLFFLFGVVQILPLPRSLLHSISPQTIALRESLLGEKEGPVTISFYPYETLRMLRLVFAAFAVFVVAVNVFRHERILLRFFRIVAVVAGLLSCLAVMQILSGTDKIYWLIPTGHSLAQGGTFVNRNNFCIFTNLSLGACLFLLLLSLGRRRRYHYPGRSPAREAWEFLTSPKGVTARWLIAACTVMAVSVFLSLSRGGAMSLLGAGVITGLIMSAQKSRQKPAWLLGVLGLLAFAVLLYAGFDAVYDRLATLQDKEAYRNRWQIISDIIEAFPKFAIVGTGLGTHQFVYPMFDRGPWPRVAEFAENEYIQLAEETGFVGLSLVGLFLLMLIFSYVRCLRGSSFHRCLAYGIGFSLIAVSIHSFGDFGLHLPANTLLASALFGALVGAAQRVGKRKNPSNVRLLNPNALFVRRLKIGLLIILFGVVWIRGLWDGARAAMAESIWREALVLERDLADQQWNGSNEEYAAIIRKAQEASKLEPGNIKYRYWLAVYRWHAVSRVRDPESGALIFTPLQLKFVERIVEELKGLREFCPTYGPAYSVAGQLELFILERKEGKRLIEQGYMLARNNPTACFVAGLVEAMEGRDSRALEKFKRSLVLEPSLFGEIVDLLINKFKKPKLAVELAGDKVQRLLQVVRLLKKLAPEDKITKETELKAKKALQIACQDPDAPYYLMATYADYCRKDGDYDSAILYYKRALDYQPANVGWRFSLAQCLAEKVRYREAIEEARICLRLRPTFKAARNCIAHWSIIMPPEEGSGEKPLK